MTNTCELTTADGFKIAAVHTRSKGNQIVLWLHGITVDKNEYLDMYKKGVKYLASRGIDSLRIDFRGHGESGGTSLDFSIVGQMFDVQCAIKYLRQQYNMERTNLRIVGCSFGAPPAIFSAIRYPKLLKGIILIAPVLSYTRTFFKPETQWAKTIFNKKTLSAAVKTKQLLINDNFSISIRLIEEMRLIRPDVALGQVKQKIMIIHGEKDSMVPYAVSKDLSLQYSTIKFVNISGMDHGFMDAEDEEGTSQKSRVNELNIFNLIAAQCL